MLAWLKDIFFPSKCILCRKVLDNQETDLCEGCRKHVPEFPLRKNNLSFIAHWTAIWYYKDTVRSSLLRYKFYNCRGYAAVYGRLLAMKLQSTQLDDFDILTWVPLSRLRKWKRGYDQMELVAKAVAKELGISATSTLRKQRHTPPQSTLTDAAHRRANVLGVFQPLDPASLKGKRILLLDDIVTTGATASECARVLLTAGAKEVSFAAIAAASYDKE